MTEVEARRQDEEHEGNVVLAERYWSSKAKSKDWDCVKADMSVYQHSGVDVKEDPRRTAEYRERVLEG